MRITVPTIALLTAATVATSAGLSASSSQVISHDIAVRTAGSSAAITVGGAGDLELKLEGSAVRVLGRVNVAGSLALAVNGRTVPLPDGPIDILIEVGSSVPVTAIVTHGALSSATLKFSRIDGRITVSSSVKSASGSATATSSSSSETRR